MRRLVITAVLGATGCGRFDFGAAPGDGAAADGTILPGERSADTGSPDAPCTSFSAFSAPVSPPELESSFTDWGPTMSPDQLTITFASQRTGPDTIYQSTRASTGATWSAPAAVMVGGTALTGDDPYLSEDGLALYWADAASIMQATRASTSAAWSAATTVLTADSSFSSPGGPDVLPGGLILLFTATLNADSTQHLFEATRAATTDAFASATLLPGLASAMGDAYGSITPDGLRTIFQRTDVTAGLYEATRASTADAFGAPVRLTELDDAGDQKGDADISDDGRTLVFASTRAGSWDLWFSARTCE
jgi:hypothetical protein